MTRIVTPGAHREWLEGLADDLLRFGRHAALPTGGFGTLDDRGMPASGSTIDLLIACRMTHVNALGVLLGRESCASRVDHGVAALTDVFFDDANGGWYKSVRREDSAPADDTKDAYSHAFVLLAATSALQVGHPDADALLAKAIDVIDTHFWDDQAGWMKESWDRAFTRPEPYRGANSNMHSVEAFLAASDATGDPRWLERALRIAERLIHVSARSNSWRIIEHFDADGVPDLEYNADDVAHQYRPYGATIGHALEWSRLLLHLRAAIGDGAPEWLEECSARLYETAVDEGWAVDGTDGFVYTTDWDGKPVVRARLHWVIAEAIGATAARWQVFRDDTDAVRYQQLWEHVDAHFLDHEHGSWFHELNTENLPARDVWAGKPDLYHALQTVLIPRVPLAPSLAAALNANLLDTPELPIKPLTS